MNPQDDIFFSIKKVAERYTSSTRKIYRLMAGSMFPKPVTIGGSKKWALSDLIAYEDRLRKQGEDK